MRLARPVAASKNTSTFIICLRLYHQALRMPALEAEAELKKELAGVLYSRGALSLGKAAEMAGGIRAQFESFLARRRIEHAYTAVEFDRDLSWAKAGQ